MWQAVGNTRMNQWASGALMTEGDLGESAAANGPLLAMAGQFANNDRFTATTGHRPEEPDLRRRLHVQVQGLRERGGGELAPRRRPRRAPSSTPRASSVQASYAWKAPGIAGASFWEIAVRYARVDPSDLVADNDQKEIGGAFNYYYNRHNLKVQADFRQIEDDAANCGRGTKNKEFRLQTQFIF